MEDARLKFYTSPVITGVPSFQRESPQKTGKSGKRASFQEVLQQKLGRQPDITFSKHAVSRVAERSIDLSEGNMARLSEGIKLAGEKGLNDTLILVDQTAFLVNIQNRTVITAVGGSELAGNIFTNIDGTVVI